MITSPSTSSALTRIEPRIAVCATTSSPALSAKITTKNSGRLPSVACRSPVDAGPKRCPTCSVANDTIQAAAGQRDAGEHEREHVREAVRKAPDRSQDQEHDERNQSDALDTCEPLQLVPPRDSQEWH